MALRTCESEMLPLRPCLSIAAAQCIRRSHWTPYVSDPLCYRPPGCLAPDDPALTAVMQGGSYRPNVVRIGAEEALSPMARHVWTDQTIDGLLQMDPGQWEAE